MNRTRTSGILIIVLVLICEHCLPQQLKFQSYGPEAGLSQAFIYTINQDQKGFLWIGTAEGYYRFDGHVFSQHSYQDSPGGNFINTSYSDSEGRLWFGHMNGSFSLFDGNEFKVFDTDTVNPSAISGISETEAGEMWISLQSGDLFILDSDLELKKAETSHENVLIFSMLYIGNDLFLFGTSDGVYTAEYAAEQNRLEFLQFVDGLEGITVNHLLQSEKTGDLAAISSREGVFTIVTGDDESFIAKPLEIFESIPPLNIKGAFFDSEGQLWLGSLGKGVMCISRSTKTSDYTKFKFLNTDNGLPSNDVRCIFEDAEGNMWFGLYGMGLARQIKSRLTFYSYEDELVNNAFYSLAREGNQVWAASHGQVIKISGEDGAIQKIYTAEKGIPDDRITALYCHPSGRLWLGTESSGLYILDISTGNVRKEFLSRDELSNSVNYITGQEDEIWVATKNGLCMMVPRQGIKKWFTTDDGLSHNNIQHLFIDSRGLALIGTRSNSLQYIDEHGNLDDFNISNLSFPLPITCISEDAAGNIWVGTYGNGVYKIEQTLSRHYLLESGLLSDYCYGIVSLDGNNFLVSHRGGLTEIDLDSDRVMQLAGNTGISGSTEFYYNAATGTPNGQVWFGSSDGLMKYDYSISDTDRHPPFLNITGCWINNEPIDADSNINLKPGYYKIEIEFTGISFHNPDLVKYRYYLEGFDQDWSDITPSRKAIYGRIGHGEYTFHVNALTGSNISNEDPVSLDILIRTPFYLRSWFYIVLIATLIVSVYAIIVLRERNLKIIQKKLIQNLDNKTKEVILKEEIIKERKKVEKELIDARNHAEQSDKLKSAFLANISHEIRTPMNAIIGFSQLLNNVEITEEKRNYFIDLIQTNSNSLLTLLDNIIELSHLETGQLKLDIQVCHLNSFLEKLQLENAEILEQAGKSKEIEFKFIPGIRDDTFGIKTDQLRLRQILERLLDNAIKYTESGHIHFGYELNENYIKFFVTDTGIGLDKEHKENMFKLFGKVGEEYKDKLYSGTGLGLSISQRLVVLLGGKIGVESEPGQGSTFYFNLPINKS